MTSDSTTQDPPLIPCIVSAMVAMALVDGQLTFEEKDSIVHIIAAHKRETLSPSDVLRLVEETLARFDEIGEPGWQAILAEGRKLSTDDKRLVMDAAGTMALVDAELHPEEQELLSKIAAWIGMETRSYFAWLEKFQERAPEPLQVKRPDIDSPPPEASEVDPEDGVPHFVVALRQLAQGNSVDGVELLRQGVGAGEETAMTFLANLHISGEHGVPVDGDTARRLFERAVAGTNISGTFFFGLHLFQGNVLRRDKKRGLHLIKKAALMNSPEAQYFLAGYHGRRFRISEAGAWALLSADNGYEDAQSLAEGVSDKAREIAGEFAEAISALKQLVIWDAEKGMARLEAMARDI